MADGVGTVKLTPHEVAMAAGVGMRRQVSALAANRRDRHGLNPEDGWRVHIEGACGELAVAKYLGKYWDGSVDTFRSLPDLGNVEIRTRSKHGYELLIRKDDDPDKFYILVTGIAPNYRVRGWIKGKAARRDEWWQNHGGREPAWFVPHQALTPISRKQDKDTHQ
jgi:hypothetical protein